MLFQSLRISLTLPRICLRAAVFESLKAQTIGFENIEWIVVIHIQRSGIVKPSKNMIGGYQNV